MEQEKTRRGLCKNTRGLPEKTEDSDIRNDLTNLVAPEERNGEKQFDSATEDKHYLGEIRGEVSSLSASHILEDVENKDLDREKDRKLKAYNDEGAGIVEPEEVSSALEEKSSPIVEEKRIADLSTELQVKLQQTRKEVETFEEPSPLNKFESRLRFICDKIIQMQREIINGKSVW